MAQVQDHPYIFGNPALDRWRLETQTRLYSDYVRRHAREFCGDNVGAILDLGCGEGQLGLVLKEVYPQASLVGVDRDSAAIAKAGYQASLLDLTKTHFLTMDVEEGLPEGEFDLIYCSFILFHTRNPRQVVERAYAQLLPGGHLWVKDFDPQVLNEGTLPRFLGGSYVKMVRLMTEVAAKVGYQPSLMNELPAWLVELGASGVRSEREYYPVGGNTEAGVATLAITLGAFLNATPGLARILDIPEPELSALYTEVVNRAVGKKEEAQTFTANIIAHKPIGGEAAT